MTFSPAWVSRSAFDCLRWRLDDVLDRCAVRVAGVRFDVAAGDSAGVLGAAVYGPLIPRRLRRKPIGGHRLHRWTQIRSNAGLSLSIICAHLCHVWPLFVLSTITASRTPHRLAGSGTYQGPQLMPRNVGS